MSEELLKAIIRLLVIVAKEEGVVDESEKETVREFLYENVTRDDTKHYLKILDEYVNEDNDLDNVPYRGLGSYCDRI